MMLGMISRIEGDLTELSDGRAMLACGAITYELLIPGYDQQRLAACVGQPITFHTLHYLEAQGPTGPFIPRLIGFSSPGDRAFFELFTTVKGMGNRKALRALQLPSEAVAGAIAQKDVDLLKSLPEIGKRTAETIVAELSGKVDRFVELKPHRPTRQGGDGATDDSRCELIRDAVAVLVQLGEQKLIARQLVDRALAADVTLTTPDQLMAAALRLKQLA
jgi:Holliday junction DNA helicase RuvA